MASGKDGKKKEGLFSGLFKKSETKPKSDAKSPAEEKPGFLKSLFAKKPKDPEAEQIKAAAKQAKKDEAKSNKEAKKEEKQEAKADKEQEKQAKKEKADEEKEGKKAKKASDESEAAGALEQEKERKEKDKQGKEEDKSKEKDKKKDPLAEDKEKEETDDPFQDLFNKIAEFKKLVSNASTKREKISEQKTQVTNAGKLQQLDLIQKQAESIKADPKMDDQQKRQEYDKLLKETKKITDPALAKKEETQQKAQAAQDKKATAKEEKAAAKVEKEEKKGEGFMSKVAKFFGKSDEGGEKVKGEKTDATRKTDNNKTLDSWRLNSASGASSGGGGEGPKGNPKANASFVGSKPGAAASNAQSTPSVKVGAGNK